MSPAAEKQIGSARDFLPPERDLGHLRKAVQNCRGCELYRNATQAVFGEGRKRARLLLVGEQPGNDEDLAGHPFVGPAGRLLDEALQAAGIDRDDAYVTNTVKHFKWEPRGKRRLHSKPGAREIQACLPWLEAELAEIRPEVLVCLGATAAQALLGRSFKVMQQRGRVVASPYSKQTLATVHPSMILRQRDSQDREREFGLFVTDLKQAAALLS
jgi:uracil-DNA glycosylase family protein